MASKTLAHGRQLARHTARLALAGALALGGCDDAVPAGSGGGDAEAAPDLGTPCRFNSECGAAQRCDDGQCVDANPCAAEGRCLDAERPDALAHDAGADASDASGPCGPGEVATDAGCAPDPLACTRNADCERGFACDAETRRCVPEVRLCVSRLDCFAGERCVDGRCAPGGDEDAGPRPDQAVDPREDQGILPVPDVGVRDLDVPDEGLPDAAVDLDQGAGGAGGAGGEGGAGGQVMLPDQSPPDLARPDAAIPDLATPDAERLDAAVPDAFVALPTPPRGIYEYEKLPVANQRELNRVAFHPDGTYALVLSVSGAVFAVDWATGTVQRFEPGGANAVYWTDLAFTRDGARAILTGYTVPANNTQNGVIYHFEDATYRAAEPAPLVHQVAADRAGDGAMGIELAPDGGLPVVLFSRRVGGGYNAVLRDYDAATGTYGAFIAATVSSAGASDLAFVNDAFGDPGILVTCGLNGADFYFYSFEGGAGAWQPRPGGRNVGNLGGISSFPDHSYALFISWSSSGRIHRFSGGALRAEQVSFGTQSIWRVAFQPNGQRALVVGRQGVPIPLGRVIEYRHDAFNCPSPFNNCDLTDVSIPGFGLAPYNSDGNHRLNDAAFHPHCDSGFVVGGYTNFNTNIGHLIRFDVVNGNPCP